MSLSPPAHRLRGDEQPIGYPAPPVYDRKEKNRRPVNKALLGLIMRNKVTYAPMRETPGPLIVADGAQDEQLALELVM